MLSKLRGVTCRKAHTSARKAFSLHWLSLPRWLCQSRPSAAGARFWRLGLGPACAHTSCQLSGLELLGLVQ